jgi:predicted amidophosphoribosyltransferase
MIEIYTQAICDECNDELDTNGNEDVYCAGCMREREHRILELEEENTELQDTNTRLQEAIEDIKAEIF